MTKIGASIHITYHLNAFGDDVEVGDMLKYDGMKIKVLGIYRVETTINDGGTVYGYGEVVGFVVQD